MFAPLMNGGMPCDGEADHAAAHREYRYQVPPAHAGRLTTFPCASVLSPDTGAHSIPLGM
jgi:hypothetical protein